MKATEINIPTSSGRATNEDNINGLTNDLNISTDNVNTEDNIDRGQNVNKQISINIDFPNTRYRPKNDLKFPKRIIGNRERPCQHQWFDEFKSLHYDVRKDAVFCYYCMKHNAKLTAEHNKEPAYIYVGFRSWKKAPQCFRDHEATSCHTAALSYEVVVPICGDFC